MRSRTLLADRMQQQPRWPGGMLEIHGSLRAEQHWLVVQFDGRILRCFTAELERFRVGCAASMWRRGAAMKKRPAVCRPRVRQGEQQSYDLAGETPARSEDSAQKWVMVFLGQQGVRAGVHFIGYERSGRFYRAGRTNPFPGGPWTSSQSNLAEVIISGRNEPRYR